MVARGLSVCLLTVSERAHKPVVVWISDLRGCVRASRDGWWDKNQKMNGGKGDKTLKVHTHKK